MSDVLVVIPARLDSVRLPGKALADVGGVPLVERVRRAAVAAGLGAVLVATDSPAVAEVVRAAGGEVALTGPAENGTLRVAEAARGRPEPVVVNVQGDQPLLDPDHVRLAASLVSGDPAREVVGTLAARWPDGVDPGDRDRVKVCVGDDGRALDFSRTPGEPPYWLHVGMYAFTRPALARIAGLPISARARAEGLEQLTWLEAGVPVRVGRVGRAELPVDGESDLARARAVFAG